MEKILDQQVETKAPEADSSAREMVCPICGYRGEPSNVKIDVSDDDARSYLTSMLSGKPFIKSYELFGGRIVVTFASGDGTTDDEIILQVNKDIAKGRIASDNISVYRRLGIYNMLYSLYRLKVADIETDYSDKGPYIRKAKAQQSGESHEDDPDKPIYFMYKEVYPRLARFINPLLDCFDEFRILLANLTRRATDSDFWNAIL